MKKILLFTAFAIFAFSTAQSQNMKVGVDAMIPMGDVKDGYSFGIGGNFTYFFEINEAFLVGPQASLLYYMGKETNGYKPDAALFLPLAGSARYIIEDFFFGADLGYGIGLAPDGNDGGFFYRPKAGYNFGVISAVLSYTGITSNRTTEVPGYGSIPGYTIKTSSTFSSLNFGVEFSF
ncbi:MAG TPA: hypothetical protein VKX40_00740 [Aequorivita sp.]|nr:hypothetical protein [Aequorivita sp.]